MFKTKKKKEKAILIGLQTEDKTHYDVEESLAELALLADTADVKILQIESQSRHKPHPAYYIGSGKGQLLAKIARRKKANLLIFDDELTPSQSRNLAKITKVKVIDRTQLILDIFAQHANTKQSSMQVELAQLQYNLSRLKGQWPHLSRIEGGIGFRGPGEKQLEVDRRRIRDRISLLKSKLTKIEKSSEIKRKKREDIFSVSMVGYTNAGKTTLLNRLTSSHSYVADKLFATLDTITRGMNLKTNDKILISDTIGFIRKLPTRLISSFHATLLEVINADLLMHVIDISHSKIYEYMETVFETIDKIGAINIDMLLVFNKIDLLPTNQFMFMRKKLRLDFPNSVFISAKTGKNIGDIEKYIIKIFDKYKKVITLKIPNDDQSFVSFLYDNAEILDKRYNNKFSRFKIRIPYKILAKNFDIIRKYQCKTKKMASRRKIIASTIY